VALGSAAYTFGDFGAYHKGTFLQASSASSLSTVCVLGGLMLIGFSIFWLGLFVFALIQGFTRRGLRWAPTANALIFPLGTVCTAWRELSIVMDSPTFRALTAIFLVILVILLLVNFVFIGIGLAKGQLLIVRDDPRVKHE
jgi:tellurite resistance protein TehA-like permease